MRLIFTMLLAVILSAVFCSSTARNPTQAGSEEQQPVPGKNKPTPKAVEKCTLSFNDFKEKYSKKYASTAEQKYRQHVFYANLKILNKHNNNPNRTYNMRANSFLDIEKNQFREVYTKTYHSNSQSWNISNQFIRKNREKIDEAQGKSTTHSNDTQIQQPEQANRTAQEEKGQNNSDSYVYQDTEENHSRVLVQSNGGSETRKNINIDWTLNSGKVRFQGTCGACYAFSAVDTIAALNSIKKFGFFVPMSVQQVVDCSANGLTFGCRGGFLEGAFTYIQMKGITLQSSYPYTYQSTSTVGPCKISGGPFKLSSFTPIEQGNCNAIIDELANGPMSVGVSGYNLQYYGEGIFDECSNDLDHAVMVVGYRSGTGWRIKNSWGTDWGEQGYGWIAEGNTCGICNMAVSIRL